MKGSRPLDELGFWDRWHQVRLAAQVTGQFSSDLAVQCLRIMKSNCVSSVLELGCGAGDDALYFAENCFEVTGIDFAPTAIEEAKRKARVSSVVGITLVIHDFSEPLEFADSYFDCVYSHLSLHYFDDQTTSEIFSEVNRVLRDKGLFLGSVRSVEDPKYGMGKKVDTDSFVYDGHVRHFFTQEYLRKQLSGFKILELKPCEGEYDGKRGCFLFFIAEKTSYMDKLS